MQTIAVTREVSSALGECELTFRSRERIDLERARSQHATYCSLLSSWVDRWIALPEDREHPDSSFVEDAALVFAELAVLTRPGPASRRDEPSALESILAEFRLVERIVGPATLDGGDVFRCGRTVYVGESTRTTPDGARQLRQLLAPHGYDVVGVPVRGCLHLKSAACPLSEEQILIQPEAVDSASFRDVDVISVAPAEPAAANVLAVGRRVLMPLGYPETQQHLERSGYEVHAIDMSELIKAESGVTCSSLIFEVG